MELAPGLFSTTMVQPVCSFTFCRTIRVALSVMPPGGYGTIHRIVLTGHAVPWAWIAVEPSNMSAQSASLNSCMVVLLVVRCSSLQVWARHLLRSLGSLSYGVDYGCRRVGSSHI